MNRIFKISKRRVMTRAWEIKKGRNGWVFTFSQCLKQAWGEEKKSVERTNDELDRQYGRGKYCRAPCCVEVVERPVH